MIDTSRIKSFVVDMCDPISISKLWANKDLQEDFDIIIDDGFHDFNSNKCFLDNSIHKLKSGGFYIIEDLHTNLLPLYYELIENFKKKYDNFLFEIISNDKLKSELINNNLLVICKYQ